MTDNKRLIDARDIVLSFLQRINCTQEEAEKILKMCLGEIDAERKRSKFKKTGKDGD